MLLDDEFKALMTKAGHGNYIKKGKKGDDIWNRYRGFEFIIYPEHFENIEDLISKCKALKIPCCLSPEHNRDLKEDGSLKKSHYHFITFYEGKVTPYRAYTDFISVMGDDAFATVEVVGNMVGAVEYQAHIDNDDKAKYDKDEILGFNGFNVTKYLVKGLSDDIMGIKRELKNIINGYNILFFDELDDILEEIDYPLAEAVSRNREIQHWVKDYLKAREHRLWYAGDVEKSYTKIHMDNGTEKLIFNREFKSASSL